MSDLSQTMIDSRQQGNRFQCRFKPKVMDYFGGELYIDEMSRSKSIASVQATFYDDADEVVQNEDGDPMQYTSNARDVGHVLALAQRAFTFSYVTFDLKLQSDAAFDLRKLYFHSPRPALRSESDEEQQHFIILLLSSR